MAVVGAARSYRVAVAPNVKFTGIGRRYLAIARPRFTTESPMVLFHKPAPSRFHCWLLEQSETFQNEVLGERLAKSFRAGQVELRRYTDRPGGAITLEQLQALDAADMAAD